MNLPNSEHEIPPGHDQALRLFMASRDIPCPHCGYNLRDLAQARCPECGSSLQLVLRQPLFRRFRNPLLAIFGVLLALNVGGAWYQWMTTSASRSTVALMRTQYIRGLETLDTQVTALDQERASAAYHYVKVRSDENREVLELANASIAECQLARKQIEVAFRSIPSPLWFTLKWWKANPALQQPHALFVLGAIVSAFALALLLAWRRALRFPALWLLFSALVAANGLLGLSLLLI